MRHSFLQKVIACKKILLGIIMKLSPQKRVFMINIIRQYPNDSMVVVPSQPRFSSVLSLFSRLDELTLLLSDDVNSYHYTICSGDPGSREGRELDIWFWDVEKCDYDKMETYVECFANCFNLSIGSFSIVQSGEGIHFIIHLPFGKKIPVEQLPGIRALYKASVVRLQAYLQKYELPGTVDQIAPNKSKTLRVPGSVHTKDGVKWSKLFFIATSETPFDISKVQLKELPTEQTVGLSPQNDYDMELSPVAQKTESTSDNVALLDNACLPSFESITQESLESLAASAPPSLEPARKLVEDVGKMTKKKERVQEFFNDTEAVLSGCKFLKFMKENQTTQDYPSWFAMLSILSRLDNSEQLAKSYSEHHPKYNEHDTLKKLADSAKAEGPAKCETINTLWNGCSECVHYKKVTTPCNIKSPDFIASERTGFWHTDRGANGKIIRTAAYEDLVKKFKKDNHLVTLDVGVMYKFNGIHYDEYKEASAESWCHSIMNPKPRTMNTKEFTNTLMRSTSKPTKFLQNHSGFLCLRNGIFDLTNFTLEPHSPKYGFTGYLDYEYDPTATCPRFDSFLQDVLAKDDAVSVLEFMANALSGTRKFYQKILVLSGTGDNGKSTFLSIIKRLFGDYYTTFEASSLLSDFGRRKLLGKCLAIGEEVSSYMGANGKNEAVWGMLKNLSSLGDVSVAHKGKDDFVIESTARFVITCNHLPTPGDTSDGYFRRFHIIGFDKKISSDKKITGLDEIIISEELPGIFNKLIDTLKRIAKDNYNISVSKKASEKLEIYRHSRDPMYHFIKEHFVSQKEYPHAANKTLPAPFFKKDGVVYIPTDEVYKMYNSFIMEQGFQVRVKAKPQFSLDFHDKIKPLFDITMTKVRTTDKERPRCYGGLLPKEDDAQD